jgi:hypothetical protein
MPLHRAVAPSSLGALTIALIASAAPLAQQQPRVPGTFRSSIALVPVDVRVLDRDGKPLTDLEPKDFTLFEDGVKQEILHFSSQSLTAGAPGPPSARAMRDGAATDLTPQKRRTFLIVLGRGRLEGPSKGIEAAIGFVRGRLFPQDEVAVMAYNRATDFTTNHELVALTIERFRSVHHSIESNLVQRLGGLAGIYGSKSIPVRVQAQIDGIFNETKGIGFRTVPPGRVTDAGRIADDSRIAAERVLTTEATFGGRREALTAEPPDPTGLSDASLDEFVLNNTQTMSDLWRTSTRGSSTCATSKAKSTLCSLRREDSSCPGSKTTPASPRWPTTRAWCSTRFRREVSAAGRRQFRDISRSHLDRPSSKRSRSGRCERWLI